MVFGNADVSLACAFSCLDALGAFLVFYGAFLVFYGRSVHILLSYEGGVLHLAVDATLPNVSPVLAKSKPLPPLPNALCCRGGLIFGRGRYQE